MPMLTPTETASRVTQAGKVVEKTTERLKKLQV
jgi:hypothetical protein